MELELKKKKFYELVDTLNNIDSIDCLMCEATFLSNQENGIDGLTTEQLKELQESIKLADEGKTIPHEEVMKMASEWIK